MTEEIKKREVTEEMKKRQVTEEMKKREVTEEKSKRVEKEVFCLSRLYRGSQDRASDNCTCCHT